MKTTELEPCFATGEPKKENIDTQPLMLEPKRTRIQIRNEAKILQAAREVFSESGFAGATMEKIAELADMSQPNVHRYFSTKADLYMAVLTGTLHIWLVPLAGIDPAGDPEEQLRNYIRAKLEISRVDPIASRVFGHEMLNGAPTLKVYLQTELRNQIANFVTAVESWIARGQLRMVHPMHLLFMIWAATQHYADFQPQVSALLDTKRLRKRDFADAEDTIAGIVVRGLKP